MSVLHVVAGCVGPTFLNAIFEAIWFCIGYVFIITPFDFWLIGKCIVIHLIKGYGLVIERPLYLSRFQRNWWWDRINICSDTNRCIVGIFTTFLIKKATPSLRTFVRIKRYFSTTLDVQACLCTFIKTLRFKYALDKTGVQFTAVVHKINDFNNWLWFQNCNKKKEEGDHHFLNSNFNVYP